MAQFEPVDTRVSPVGRLAGQRALLMHFTPRRDVFDHVNFYGGCLAIWLCWFVPGLVALHLAFVNPQPGSHFEIGLQYLIAFVLIGLGCWFLVQIFWERIVEVCELTESHLVFRLGWRSERIPWEQLRRIDRVDLPRAIFPPKPGWRIEYLSENRRHCVLLLAVRNEDLFVEHLSNHRPSLVTARIP